MVAVLVALLAGVAGVDVLPAVSDVPAEVVASSADGACAVAQALGSVGFYHVGGGVYVCEGEQVVVYF